MSEDIEITLETTKEGMDQAIAQLQKRLLTIRAGKASPNMLQGVMVDYYGSPTPLAQVANVLTPDGRTISIQPWEKAMIPEIEKAIINANLGFNPMNNGESIIINVPPLTEERRRDLVKQARSETEDARIRVRNDRRDANNDIKRFDDASEDEKKNAEVDIQTLTDSYIKKIDDILSSKEKEIMTV